MLATLGCRERGMSHHALTHRRERAYVALIHQHLVGVNLIRWRRERCASEGDKEVGVPCAWEAVGLAEEAT